MNDVKMGKLFFDANEAGERDAVHVAVVPVEAAEPLKPGQRVGLTKDGKATANATHIGIVDPWLEEVVPSTTWFYLCMDPGTVTSIRHHWTHPAFNTTAETEESEKWLGEYAAKQNCYDGPDRAFERLLDGLRTGELFFHGSDLHGLDDLDDAEELRFHGERYLGVRIDWNRFQFSCSC